MIEKTEQSVKALRIAVITTAVLATTALSAGFVLVCLDYINPYDFGKGVGIGAAVATGVVCSFAPNIKSSFFKPFISEEEKIYIFDKRKSERDNPGSVTLN